MALKMDDVYAEAKSRLLAESYSQIREQLVRANGEDKALRMMDGLFPKAERKA